MHTASPSGELNLRIIQRLDARAQRIIFTGRHVVVYVFEGEVWDRAGIEGTLFLYESSPASHAFVVLNRQKTENFVQPLAAVDSLQFENDFLMFSGQDGAVHGLWFFSPDELAGFCRALNQVTRTRLRPPPSAPPPAAAEPSVMRHLRDALHRRAAQPAPPRRRLAIEDLFGRIYASGAAIGPQDAPADFAQALLALLQGDESFLCQLAAGYCEFVDAQGRQDRAK